MAYISLDQVVKRYQMGEVTITAADHITFDVEKGEFVIIVGPSGAGKTTVLNILGGMDSCDEGTITVDGSLVSSYNSRQLTTYRRYDIGFVFQFYNLVQNLTALENVELAAQICRNPLPAGQVLEKEGLSHIRVRKAGLLREAVFGNYYNVLTKTIYLRSWLGKIDKKKSVTSVALGVQKAALAKLCEEGDQKTLLRNRLSLIAIFGPLLFLPVLIAGVVLDFVLLDRMGPFSLAGLVLSGLLAVCGLVVTLLNIPVEKQANRLALEMMERFGLASGAELETMRGVYDAYIVAYVAQFLLQMLRMIQWALEIVIKLQQKEK